MKVKALVKSMMLIVAASGYSVAVFAEPSVEELANRLERMQQEMDQLKQQLNNSATKEEVRVIKNDVATVGKIKQPDTLMHITGYADVGYTETESEDGSFNVGTFAPIFHFQYRDIVMLESELEIKIEDDGETETNLEYLTIDWFINDYTALVAGKFLSPIGQFRQNLHPSWINKLASAPPGFGHDGAAPVSDMGFQLRGGFPMGKARANYAVYVSNGPELISTSEDGEYELEGIEAEGFGSDADGEKVFGGRIGIIPFPGFELGFSAATGEAVVTSIEAGHDGEEAEEEDDHGDEPLGLGRDYDVIGADFAWQIGRANFRGEYVKTEVGDDEGHSITASKGGEWETWYTQGSYQIEQTKWEVVARYTDFDSPHNSQDQKQWAIGTNYLFTESFIGKISYEFNDGQKESDADKNVFLLQMAYGF